MHCSSLWQLLRQILSFEEAGWFHVSCSLWMVTGSPSGLGHKLISAGRPAQHSLFNKFSVLLTGSVPRLCELLQVEKGDPWVELEGFFGGGKGLCEKEFSAQTLAGVSLTKRFWGWGPFWSACPLCYPAGSSGCCGWGMGAPPPLGSHWVMWVSAPSVLLACAPPELHPKGEAKHDKPPARCVKWGSCPLRTTEHPERRGLKSTDSSSRGFLWLGETSGF